MALDYETAYPGQVETASTEYPYGKAQNETVAGDGTGTPFERSVLNDIWGFLQRLLSDAGITPSGNADTVLASQYSDALESAVGTVIEDSRTALVGQVRGLAMQSEGGEILPGASVTSTKVGILYLDDVLIASTYGNTGAGNTCHFCTSSNQGGTFVSRFTDSLRPSYGFVGEPGGYALALQDDDRWFYASAPFTSWTVGSDTAAAMSGVNAVAAVTMESSRRFLFVGTDGATKMAHCSATTAPTTAADWSQVDMSSITDELPGVASGNGFCVVAGTDVATTQARVFWCNDTDGDDVGDWTGANLGSSATIQGLVFDGTNFIAIDDDGAVFYAADPSGTWTQGYIHEDADDAFTRLQSNGRGLTIAYDSQGVTGDDIWASYDGGVSFVLAVPAADNEVVPPGGGDGAVNALAIDDAGNIYGFDDAVSRTRCIRTVGG